MSFAKPHAEPLPKTIVLSGRRKVTLLRELGRGIAATAYRGILESDAFVRRPVVVKLFDLSSNEEPDTALLALGRAAQRAAYVVHPNVVQTYEMAPVGGNHAAVVTELVEGTTLERLVRVRARSGGEEGGGRRTPLDLALFVATEIAEALSGARMATTPEGIPAGIAHLHIAPHQVLLSFQGEVKLSDFGLAELALRGSRVRPMHRIAERWATIAPEVAQGRPGDTRSDVFSLGIIFREMLVGPRFGPDLSDAEVVEHTREGVVPPTFLELQLSPDVSTIVRRALEPDPAKRYPHATAMAYELRRVALSMGVGDGRMFLRTAIAEQMTSAANVAAAAPRSGFIPATSAIDPEWVEETTEEHDLEAELELAERETPRLVADRTSGLILKAGGSKKTRGGND
jgi:eukaryotic-like serine/threonine-protein kinase